MAHEHLCGVHRMEFVSIGKRVGETEFISTTTTTSLYIKGNLRTSSSLPMRKRRKIDAPSITCFYISYTTFRIQIASREVTDPKSSRWRPVKPMNTAENLLPFVAKMRA